MAAVLEGCADLNGYVEDPSEAVDPGAFRKAIAQNGGRMGLGWQSTAPIGVTAYIAAVGRTSLPKAALGIAPLAPPVG